MKNTFLEKIKEGRTLPDVETISWLCKGDDYFKAEKTSVVLESSTGEQWELLIHSPFDDNRRKMIDEDEVILNVVLSHHHIDMSGLWCGITADIPKVVNEMRKKYPYKLTFEVKKGTLFNSPEYRF